MDMENIQQRLAERLRLAIKEADMTQKALADATGIQRNQINSYSTGKAIPTRKRLMQMAKVLKVSELWLMGYDVSKTEGTPEYDANSGVLTIPFVNQKASAGLWEEELPDECIETKAMDILPALSGGQPFSSLLAIEVVGDSMVDENINDGDIVVFSRGRISGDGLYVVVLGGIVAVKRLEFDGLTNSVRVISANKARGYAPVTIANDEGTYRILGKVTGWIHGNHN